MSRAPSEVASARSAVVAAFDLWAHGRPGRIVALADEFAAGWRAGEIAPAPSWMRPVRGSTIYTWRRDLRRDGEAGLAPQYSRGPRAQDLRDLVEALLTHRPGASAPFIRRRIEASGDDPPSLRTLQRVMVDVRRHRAAAIQAVTDPDGYRSRRMPAFGRADADIPASGLWELDSSPADNDGGDGRMRGGMGMNARQTPEGRRPRRGGSWTAVPEAPPREALDALSKVSAATVSTQLLKRGLRTHCVQGVLPLNAAKASFAAPAFTLRYIPAREDKATPEIWRDREYPQRKAIETVPPGWALAVDAMGDRRAGSMGDILVLRLQKRGVAALVTDGALRDTPELAKMDFPAFCAGAAAPASIATLFAVDLQCPIACGGAAVFPGDVLVGDAEGVAVVPHALAAEVACDAVEQERLERFVQGRIRAGQSTFGNYPPGEETLAAYAEWTEEDR